MSKNPYRQEREELKNLLQQLQNLKEGKSNSFIEEDGFERIIERIMRHWRPANWPSINTPIRLVYC
jgi:hypothetical protein